jgi:hypothetical protein
MNNTLIANSLKKSVSYKDYRNLIKELLAEASYIENAPYYVIKEEKSFSGGGLEKYINTTVGNHATCATTSCRAKPITYRTENKV